MKRILLGLTLLALGGLATAQEANVFQWPEVYAPTATQGGEISEYYFGDITTLNPVLTSNAQETAILGMFSGPGLIYRDWVGNRAFRNEDGTFNTYWADSIEEVQPDQEYVITLKQGWQWSDGTEMTADDAIAARTIIGDPEVESNSFSCSEVDGEPVVYEKIDTYQYRITLPEPQVNGLAVKDCGTVPAHIFMPVYEAEGAAGIKALWGVDTDVSEIVSGGPYMLSEFRAGERLTLEKNPTYGGFVQAADGSPLPGPDRWVLSIVEDQNQILAAAITGQTSFYWPQSVDQLRAVQEAVQSGTINGELYPNIGPDTLVDFITYNFNATDECKRTLFRSPAFRQAVSIMIDREALIQAALGGLGFAAEDWNSDAAAPFDAPNIDPFEYNPERGVELLNSAGYTELGSDGVLMNPETGCRVAFDLQFPSGNDRRSQEALVMAQTLAPYGVQVNPREVDSATWGDSITGTSTEFEESGARKVDYDAQIWGLAGGDVDNPAFPNGLRLGTNLNAWNKSTTDVEPWEILMDRLTVQMSDTLDLDERVAVYNERAELMREYLPMTPLISPAYHFYENMDNIWAAEAFDANSIESPYRPGNYRENLLAP